jgi:hypothetical protein
MIGLTYGNFQSGAGFVGLLDTYPNAAAAYSLRLLKSDYAGALVEIAGYTTTPTFVENRAFLPDANNKLSLTSQDVGLTTTLNDWITNNSITDGYVRTWYDQSGNGVNATQTSASAQPQIINGGSFILKNNRPTIEFNGTTNYLRFNTYTGNNSQFHVVDNFAQSASFTRLLFFTASNLNTNFAKGTVAKYNTGSNYLFLSTNSEIGTATTTTAFPQDHLLISILPDEAENTPLAYQNGSLTSKTNSDTPRPSAAGTYSYIGARKRGDDSGVIDSLADFDYQEIIIYSSDETANRVEIENNINLFYSIY